MWCGILVSVYCDAALCGYGGRCEVGSTEGRFVDTATDYRGVAHTPTLCAHFSPLAGMLQATTHRLLLATYYLLAACVAPYSLHPLPLCAHVFSLAGMRRRCCCPSVRGASAFLCRARLGAGSCLRRKRGRLEHHAAVESRWALGLTVQKCCRRCLLYGRLKTRKRARLLERHTGYSTA
jgi:hypothetical protein